ncbi:MAG: serine protease [Nannocystaceae bacterium]
MNMERTAWLAIAVTVFESCFTTLIARMMKNSSVLLLALSTTFACDGTPKSGPKAKSVVTPPNIASNAVATTVDVSPPLERVAAVKEVETTEVCPPDSDTDADPSYPEHDQRRLFRDVKERGLPAHVGDNAKATVIVVARDAVSDCTDTDCRIKPTGNYERHAAIEGSCSTSLPVCPEKPFSKETILLSDEGWPVRRCSGVLVAEGVVATASHCLNLTLATSKPEPLRETDVDDDAEPSDFALVESVRGKKGNKGNKREKKFRVTDYDQVVFVAGVDDWSKPIPREHMAEASLTLYMENWKIVLSNKVKDVADVALIQVRPFVPHKSQLSPHASPPNLGESDTKEEVAFPNVRPVALGSAPSDGDPLYVLGHPVGLPLTVSGCANATVEDGRLAFDLSADVMHGSSGSPVFEATTGDLVGLIQDDGIPWKKQLMCCDLTGLQDTLARASRFDAAAGFIRRLEQQRE